MTAQFRPPRDFLPERLIPAPLLFDRLPGPGHRLLVTSETGDFAVVTRDVLERLLDGRLAPDDPAAGLLMARGLARPEGSRYAPLLDAVRYRTRKAFLRGGPALHIFVVTLRCDHGCHYCQVSRQSPAASRYDMDPSAADAAADRLFDSPAPLLTIEFQGGEPLLNFPLVRRITERIAARAIREGRRVAFSMASTLHHADAGILDFLAEHHFAVSTSIDGPAALHDRNRPLPGASSHARTLAALDRARAVLGRGSVSALVTLTAASLTQPEAVVDTYADLGFDSIFLRPLSPYGFAERARHRIGYATAAFLDFYARAFDHILALNRRGTALREVYAALLLGRILGPFADGYVDLRSPAGAGLGALVYNYNGRVYPSDEARMLAEMGNSSLALGHCGDRLGDLLHSPVMAMLLGAGIAEALPGCADCAYRPYCGSDPVHHLATVGDPVGHRALSDHCRRHLGLLRFLFGRLLTADAETLALFDRWAAGPNGEAS